MGFWFKLSLRTRLGILSTAAMAAVVVVMLSWFYDPDHFSYNRANAVLRYGPLLFLLWLAWADLKKIPWWGWIAIPVIFLFCLLKPALWLFGIPAVGFILFYKA
ncbi:MAG: hypothetical protein LBH00_03410 [Planctomycetaceae bacterium]|jgi:hypothetical protein|nr:hypothetical protein [Planctomycetaceae bacterium]